MVSGVRATFGFWPDRLIAVLGLLIILMCMRAWFADRSWAVATWAGLAGGALVGISAGRSVAARLAFHGFDGPLAADALQIPTRRAYRIAWHAIGLVLLATVTVVARPALMMFSLSGYAAGALIGGGSFGFGVAGLASGRPRFGRAVRSWTQRPRAGMVGALILTPSLVLLANFLGTDAMIAVTGVGVAMLVLPLTAVDDRTVRFLTIAGHGSWRIIARQARGTLVFVALAAPLCAIAVDAVYVGIVFAVAAAALLLMTMRILVYRLHDKRAADFIVTILIALLVLAASATPIIVPLVAIAIYGQLLRRAAPKTWLLA